MISSFAPFILVTFSVIAQVTSAGYTLCLEKDWLLALARDEAELTGMIFDSQMNLLFSISLLEGIVFDESFSNFNKNSSKIDFRRNFSSIYILFQALISSKK